MEQNIVIHPEKLFSQLDYLFSWLDNIFSWLGYIFSKLENNIIGKRKRFYLRDKTFLLKQLLLYNYFLSVYNVDSLFQLTIIFGTFIHFSAVQVIYGFTLHKGGIVGTYG